MTVSSPNGRILVSLGKTAAQISAQFAPVPGLSPMVDALCGIIQLCDNVTQNRYAARQLRDRCHILLLSLRQAEEHSIIGRIADARNAVHDCLIDIQTQMSGWANMGTIQSFINQREIQTHIQECHVRISDCVTKFQLASHFEIHEWQRDFAMNTEHDHAELSKSLSQIQSSQDITNAALSAQGELIKQMMTLMQSMMGQNKQEAEKVHTGISSNLYDLQRQCGELLPDFHLKSGEAKKTSEYAIRGTATMDVFEGLYLEREKVTIKAIRAINADERSLRRFKREVKIWAAVWKRDRGKHILPFYGYCQTEGPFPYMVSPWQQNGDVVTYVKKHDPDIDYLHLIKDIALGIQVLHSMQPPIVHGDIRGANVLVSDEGKPLISDFGLSQVIHDVSGIPFTQSSGVADSYRYFAPEICLGKGILSTRSDMYAFAMTVLEILTHEQPYHEVKHHPEAVLKASQGKQPARPCNSRVLARGLDDKIWVMLSTCWSLKPSERPSIQDALSILPEDTVLEVTK